MTAAASANARKADRDPTCPDGSGFGQHQKGGQGPPDRATRLASASTPRGPANPATPQGFGPADATGRGSPLATGFGRETGTQPETRHARTGNRRNRHSTTDRAPTARNRFGERRPDSAPPGTKTLVASATWADQPADGRGRETRGFGHAECTKSVPECRASTTLPTGPHGPEPGRYCSDRERSATWVGRVTVQSSAPRPPERFAATEEGAGTHRFGDGHPAATRQGHFGDQPRRDLPPPASLGRLLGNQPNLRPSGQRQSR